MPVTLEPLDYMQYVEALRQNAQGAKVSEYGVVEEQGRRYPLLRLSVPGDPLVVVTSGFHGEERSGPLTLSTRFGDVVQTARRLGVGLEVFPCVNPSGFERGTRYNVSGEKPNNDFLRYETSPGVWKGELGAGESFSRFTLYDGGPKETRALRAALEQLPTPVAALDIHQDNYQHGAYVYAYTFGDRTPYRELLRRCEKIAPVGARLPVDDVRRTEDDGLIEFHDGSVTDYYQRRGARYVAALETTTDLPLERSREVDLIWLTGFIELAAGRG